MKIRTPISYSKELGLATAIFNKFNSYIQYFWQNCRYGQWQFHVLANRVDKVDFQKIPAKSIPIIINNFNRFNSLKTQVEWLQSLPDNIAIIIIDNQSTYQPLLEYYRQITAPNIQVVYLNFNSGIWGLKYVVNQLKAFPKYVITDPDLIPYDDMPTDILRHLSALLDKYPHYNHIGLSIEVEDIPSTYLMQETVQQWEAQFWHPKAKLLNDEVTIANVDTTFAMYRKDSNVFSFANALRTVRPYTLKHVDWYMNPQSPCPEYQYYLNHCRPIASWATEWKRKQEKPVLVPIRTAKLLVDNRQLLDGHGVK